MEQPVAEPVIPDAPQGAMPASGETPEPSITESITPAERLSITKIIHSLAGKFCERFPFLVFDDVVQEGWRVFYTYTNSLYKRDKGTTVTTWFYRGLNWELISYAEREYKKTQKWDELEDSHLESLEEDASTEFEYRDTVEALKAFVSPLCSALLDITLKEPKTSATVLCELLAVTEKDLHALRKELQFASQFVL
jgi:DNA-directed RNA polymerase specialized sigma24 family protein